MITAARLAPSPAPSGSVANDDDDRSYLRSVGIAWLISMPMTALVVTVLVLVVGDVGMWGAVAVGAFAGIWTAPLGAVAGVGVWSARHQH